MTGPTLAGVRHDHRFPIVATMADGSVRKPLHLTVGPALGEDGDLDHDVGQVTILWAWGAARRRGYPLVVTPNEPVPVAGRHDLWNLDTPDGVIRLRYKPSASCCGDPMKRWRPPGTGAARRSSR